VASLASVNPGKPKLATTSNVPSTASGRNGATGRSAARPAAAAPDPDLVTARDPSSEERTATVSQLKPRIAARLRAPWTAYFWNGAFGPPVTRNAVVVSKLAPANAKDPSLAETTATELVKKIKLATSSNARLTENGDNGAIGQTAPEPARVASAIGLAPAKDHSMAVAIVTAITRRPRRVTSRLARSTASGTIGVHGQRAANLAARANVRANVHVTDLTMEEMIVMEILPNTRTATPPRVPSTVTGVIGELGESASTGSNTRPARATTPSSAGRTVKETARRCKIVRRHQEMMA